MEKIFIYGLVCPTSEKVQYVGKTKDIEKRLSQHITRAKFMGHLRGKNEWIRALLILNMKPKIKILEECEENNWEEREIYWISYYTNLNPLFNKSVGGEDSIFKLGNIPWNKGGGEYSEGTRKKMSDAKIGTTLPEEHKSNISKSLIGKSKSESHVHNIRVSQGRIVQQFDLEDNLLNEHAATSFAAEAVGCKRESIRDACNGKIKICKGFKWKYKQ